MKGLMRIAGAAPQPLLLVPLMIPCSILFIISSTLLLSVVSSTTAQENNLLHIQKVAHTSCEGTLYPDLCVSTLATFPDLTTKTLPQMICSTINHTIHQVRLSSSNCTGLRHLPNLNKLEQRALDDCLNLFDTTIEELKTTVADLSEDPSTIASKPYHDCQTLLSGAMTNVYTCLDGFAYSKGHIREKIEKKLYSISRHVSNSLAMLKKVPTNKSSSSETETEVFPEYGEMKDGFPTWISPKDRKLLQSPVSSTKFDLVVAKDGTGNFKTIGEAIAAAPSSSTTRFVIHIKAGAYLENVEVTKKKINLMLVGDGIGKTVVKASRNVVDGWTTFQSATFSTY